MEKRIRKGLPPSPTASQIYEHIIANEAGDANLYTYIISGKPGPTGKTWLRNKLKEAGLRVHEITEHCVNFVQYNDDENHFIRDGIDDTVIIILNRRIKRS